MNQNSTHTVARALSYTYSHTCKFKMTEDNLTKNRRFETVKNGHLNKVYLFQYSFYLAEYI